MTPDDRVLILRVLAGIVAAAVFLANLHTVPIELGLMELRVPLALLVVACLAIGGATALRLRVLMIQRLGARSRKPREPMQPGHQPVSAPPPEERSDAHASWLEQRRSPFD